MQSDPQLVAWTQRQNQARFREGSLCERTACFFQPAGAQSLRAGTYVLNAVVNQCYDIHTVSRLLMPGLAGSLVIAYISCNCLAAPMCES